MARTSRYTCLWSVLLPLVVCGCGTTRVTDTQRTATEQLLVSNAVDQTVSQMDFRYLSGKPVFFDPQYLDGTVDRGYVVSSLRQHLLACGCMLQEDRNKATYVVEARSGGVGTDRNAVLIGVPQMNVPALVPGQPSAIPEIPLAKKTDQKGIAKIAVFAYNRQTGRPVWQSGTVQASSSARDTWFLGIGPLQQGTVRDRAEFAGSPLGLPSLGEEVNPAAKDPVVPVNHAANWPEPPVKPTLPTGEGMVKRFLALSGIPSLSATSTALGPPKPAAAPTPPPTATVTAPPPVTAPTPNAGGQAETEPAKVLISAFGVKPDG